LHSNVEISEAVNEAQKDKTWTADMVFNLMLYKSDHCGQGNCSFTDLLPGRL